MHGSRYWSGPATYGAVSRETALETIHAGLARGLSFVDTAPVYGAAESFIGEALRRALEERRRWDEIEAALGTIPDSGHEWDEDPGTWVHAQHRSDERAVG